MSVKVPITYILNHILLLQYVTIQCQFFFSIKYNSNYVFKTYITFQEKNVDWICQSLHTDSKEKLPT